MGVYKNFRALPVPLMGLFFVFLAVPLFSLFAIDVPWIAAQKTTFLRVLLVSLTYWVVPLAICLALLLKHNWFFVMYLLQCGLLTLHTIVAGNQQPTEMQLARFLLIGLMIYVGFLFGNKNFLYPLVTRHVRFWRKTTRYQIGRNVFLFTKNRDHLMPARLLDCSAGGLRVSIHDEDLTAALRKAAKNDSFTVLIPSEDPKGAEFVLPVEVCWTADDDKGCRQIGCRVLDKKIIRDYMATENLSVVVPLRYPNHRSLRLEQDIQETALILWLVCIALSFAVPALG